MLGFVLHWCGIGFAAAFGFAFATFKFGFVVFAFAVFALMFAALCKAPVGFYARPELCGARGHC